MGMRISLFEKILGLIVITVILVGGVVYGTNYLILRRSLQEQGQSEIKKMAVLVQRHVDDLKDKAVITAAVLADRPDLVMAVEKGDYASVQSLTKDYVKARQVSVLTIAGKDGNVVGRGHSDKVGDSVLNQINVKKSLAGQASTGIEEGTVIKFSLRAGNPIRKENLIIGSVTTGFDLSSEAFVDDVKNKFGVECTVFQDDTRTATTIMRDGKRAVGTRMDNSRVIETVLKKGDVFLDTNKIMGKDYDTAYWPLKDVDGKIVGMFFIGKDRELVEQTLKGTVIPNLLATLIIGSLMIAVSFLLVRSLVRTLNRSIQGLTVSQEQVSDASGQIASASQDLADVTSKQAASLEETSSSLEEMSSMTKKAMENSGLMAITGDKTYLAMRNSHKSLRETNACIKRIGESGTQASKIVKTSDEIAFQINLLALNAAVEAARAGEAGAGFAVVAEEVRNLAMRSAEAAKNTEEIIGEMAQDINNGISLVAKTLEDFYIMGDEGKKTNELIKEIDSAMKEQALGIEQINRAVSEMDKVTQQTAASAEESASTAEELNVLSQQMKTSAENLLKVVKGAHTAEEKSEDSLAPRRTDQKSRTFMRSLPAPAVRKENHRSKKTNSRDVIPMSEGDYQDF
jgi:methyl-accepting chemotaxis protein